jgi:hypothetical protein
MRRHYLSLRRFGEIRRSLLGHTSALLCVLLCVQDLGSSLHEC